MDGTLPVVKVGLDIHMDWRFVAPNSALDTEPWNERIEPWNERIEPRNEKIGHEVVLMAIDPGSSSEIVEQEPWNE
eukprot:CAMPEP_0196215664 /NCGR_PEP_ID=MMETSP0912-20130531/30450_1 /TAXON_ID=49265 /ORGANISM="Thalassiosira rotula, Strain GSO102" /LENGTH=75 /DNA_ID=CAMNT_0041492597 /DNA_START=372 /DNA_END=599 /DNA_ORIENTATION=+